MRFLMYRDGNKVLARPIDFEFMTLTEWHAFNDQLGAAITRADIAVTRIDPGVLVMADGRQLGVLNLAQLCHHSSTDRWPALMHDHITTLAAHVGGTPEPFSMLDLRVRLLPDDLADREVLDRLGARPFAEGVVEILTVRLADAVRPVPTSEIEELAWDMEESWASAWAQTRTLERPEEINVLDFGGADVVHLFSDHFFGASFLPFLHDVLPAIGEHGALVSIPVRHSVLVHPIHDASVMVAAQTMIPITRQINRTGPGSVSAHLYWWRNGSLTWIPTYFAPDGVEFYPPEELVDLIDSLNDII